MREDIEEESVKKIMSVSVQNKKAAPCYSPTLKSAVPWPQAGLTTEFGMESGISPPLSAQPNFETLFSVPTEETMPVKDFFSRIRGD